jgi:uncharacterized membrane protein
MQLVRMGREPARVPVLRALRRRRRLRAGAVQAVYVLAGVLAGATVPNITAGTRINSGQVVQLLAGISAGLLSLIAIVFSLLFLVVQFASTAQSPRLALFRSSPLVWHSFGLFAGILFFGIVAAIVTAQDETVSAVVPAVATFLVLVALGLCRQLQLAAFASVQLAQVLHDIAARGREVIDAMYPDPWSDLPPTPDAEPGRSSRFVHDLRWTKPQGVLTQVDVPGLFDYAQAHDCRLALSVAPGDLLREDVVVLSIEAEQAIVEPAAPLARLEVGIERTFDQDPRLAFRLLADIGLRALSPAVNDPATAIQAVDAIEGLLRTLATRELAIGVVRDERGRERLRLTVPGWQDYVAAAVDELIEVAVARTVRARLAEALRQTLLLAPPERAPALRSRLDDLLVPVGRVELAQAGYDDRVTFEPGRQRLGRPSGDTGAK